MIAEGSATMGTLARARPRKAHRGAGHSAAGGKGPPRGSLPAEGNRPALRAKLSRSARGSSDPPTAVAQIPVPKAPWSAAARRRLGIPQPKFRKPDVWGLRLILNPWENSAREESGVEPPHSKVLRTFSCFGAVAFMRITIWTSPGGASTYETRAFPPAGPLHTFGRAFCPSCRHHCLGSFFT